MLGAYVVDLGRAAVLGRDDVPNIPGLIWHHRPPAPGAR